MFGHPYDICFRMPPPETGAENDKRHQDVRGMKLEILHGHLPCVCVVAPLFLVSLIALCPIACRTAHAQPSPKNKKSRALVPSGAGTRQKVFLLGSTEVDCGITA